MGKPCGKVLSVKPRAERGSIVVACVALIVGVYVAQEKEWPTLAHGIGRLGYQHVLLGLPYQGRVFFAVTLHRHLDRKQG